MKLSTAKRRINKTLDELTQSVIDDWYDHFKNGYIKGYTDAREGVAPMYADAIADTPQTAQKIAEFQKMCGIGCSRCEGRYDCYDRNLPHAVRCNNYGKITDEPQTDCGLK